MRKRERPRETDKEFTTEKKNQGEERKRGLPFRNCNKSFSGASKRIFILNENEKFCDFIIFLKTLFIK